MQIDSILPVVERSIVMKKKYQACIFNINRNLWVENEFNGEVDYTDNEKERLIFYNKEDADATIDLVNDVQSDCFMLLEL
jgi:hypothetical protein